MLTMDFCRLAVIVLGIVIQCSSTPRDAPEFRRLRNKFDVSRESNLIEDGVVAEQADTMKRYTNFSVDPCDNFYDYACGNWDVYNPIPGDQVQYNEFVVLNERLSLQLRAILEGGESSVLSADESSAEMKVKNFYDSCMNVNLIKQRGVQPLLDLIESIGGWSVLNEEREYTEDLTALIANAKLHNVDTLFSTKISVDLDNPGYHEISIEEPRFKIPARHHFVENFSSDKMQEYLKYVSNLLVYVGVSEATVQEIATDIVDFESSIAAITSEPLDNIDWQSKYSKIKVQDLQQFVSEIDWQRYFSLVRKENFNSSIEVATFDLQYFFQMDSVVKQSKKSTIINYIFWKVIRQYSTALDERFLLEEERLTKVWLGKEQSSPRWKVCMQKVQSYIGKPLSAMYIKQFFDSESRDDVIHITRRVQAAYRDMIASKEWLDEKTKGLILEKLDAIGLQIGYPDDILDDIKMNEKYESIVIERSKFFENFVNIAAFNVQENQAKFTKPTTRDDWPRDPAVINAYFVQTQNSILLPAGVLQAPMYDRRLPNSVNYGRIGFFIGHELSHAFDEVGRSLDLSGKIMNWWSESAIDGYVDRIRCLNDLYNSYTIHGISINGNASENENVADLSGLRQALFAYQKVLLEKKKAGDYSKETFPDLPLTNMQLFFLSYAQIWCDGTRQEMIETLVKVDEHCPLKYRVIGSLSNMPEFATAFECPLGSPMNPETKCLVW